jgi:hypothetical protein
MADDRGWSDKGSVGARYLSGQAMICPECNGARYAVIRSQGIPRLDLWRLWYSLML